MIERRLQSPYCLWQKGAVKKRASIIESKSASHT
jgi:hypothetical protein